MNSWLSIALWLGYNLLDVWSTHIGLLKGYVEANPLPALVLEMASPTVLPFYKLVIALVWLGVVVSLARRRPQVWLALRLGNVLVFCAVFWNVILIG